MYHLDLLLILTQYLKKTRLGVVYTYRKRYRALLRSREVADGARSIRRCVQTQTAVTSVLCGQFDGGRRRRYALGAHQRSDRTSNLTS